MDISRLLLILTKVDLNRISVKGNPDEMFYITTDVHGMKCYQAKKIISNIINILRTTFQLFIIHGYHHGKAIKEMLYINFCNNHIYESFPDLHILRITHMFIVA